MNSSPENQPSTSKNENSSASESQPIGELIDFLLGSENPESDSLSEAKIALDNTDLLSQDVTLEGEEIPLENIDLGLLLDLDGDVADGDIEGESKPTLTEALEYQAFLQQSIKPEKVELEKVAPEIIETEIANANSIEQVTAIDTDKASPEDLADAVNALIPLIVELLQSKLNDSQERVIQTVRPVIDQLIEQRTQEDSQKMADAIAKILPSAITAEINFAPEAIAKAIAPEIAASIREQILLDQDAIPQVLGPEMGKAIKAQIESERDAMVDALYPVIGSTISKYMVEVVQDINQKVESTLSSEGVKRKIRARVQGISEAELIFKESISYHIRAIFLIHKDSGLVIQEIQVLGAEHLDSDMLAGMLTAIRSFANDCISTGSELDSIDYGDWQIPLEVAGYCYLAVVIKGEPPQQFITKIRQVLGEIVMEYDDAIQNFDGDIANVPRGVKTKLERLTESNKDKPQKSSSSPVLLWLLIFIMSIVFIPWGIVSYRGKVADSIEQNTATQLDAAPELSVYRLDPKVKAGKLTVTGRVPNDYLNKQAGIIADKIARENKLELDNQIITVTVPLNSSLVTGEIQRLTTLFNQQPQVAIETEYLPKNLTIKGFVLDKTTRKSITQAFSLIPGIEQIVFDLVEQLPIIEQRIYFKRNSSQLNSVDHLHQINTTTQLLAQYPQLHLKLVVHSDGSGSTRINQKLAKERCQKVKTAMVDRGIEPTRLVADCNDPILPSSKEDNRVWSLNRYVSFQLFLPSNLSE